LNFAFFVSVIVVLPLFLAVIGLIGNFLSFLLMNQKKYKKSTSCFYMRCLAVFDTLYIFGRMILRYPVVIPPMGFSENQDVLRQYCYCLFAVGRFTLPLSVWTLVFLSLERYIALTWPLQAAMVCTMRRAKLSCVGICCFAACLGGLVFLRKEQEKYKAWFCPYHYDEPFDEIDDTIVESVLLVYLPVSLTLFADIGIAIAIKRSHKELTNMSQSKRHTADKDMTKTIIIVTGVFFLCSLIKRTPHIFWEQWTGPRGSYWEILTINLSGIFEYTNYTLNAYLYVFTCKRFRKELYCILTCMNDKGKTKGTSAV